MDCEKKDLTERPIGRTRCRKRLAVWQALLGALVIAASMTPRGLRAQGEICGFATGSLDTPAVQFMTPTGEWFCGRGAVVQWNPYTASQEYSWSGTSQLTGELVTGTFEITYSNMVLGQGIGVWMATNITIDGWNGNDFPYVDSPSLPPGGTPDDPFGLPPIVGTVAVGPLHSRESQGLSALLLLLPSSRREELV